MLKGFLYLLTGICGLIQFIWCPVYAGISEDNLYFWVVCSNCRAFLWIFAAIDIIIGLVLLVATWKTKETTTGIDEVRGTIFLLVFSIIVVLLSLF